MISKYALIVSCIVSPAILQTSSSVHLTQNVHPNPTVTRVATLKSMPRSIRTIGSRKVLEDGRNIELVDTESGRTEIARVIEHAPVEHDFEVMSVSPDFRYVLGYRVTPIKGRVGPGSLKYTLALFDMKGRIVRSWSAVVNNYGRADVLFWSPDSSFFINVIKSHAIQVFKLPSHGKFRGHVNYKGRVPHSFKPFELGTVLFNRLGVSRGGYLISADFVDGVNGKFLPNFRIQETMLFSGKRISVEKVDLPSNFTALRSYALSTAQELVAVTFLDRNGRTHLGIIDRKAHIWKEIPVEGPLETNSLLTSMAWLPGDKQFVLLNDKDNNRETELLRITIK